MFVIFFVSFTTKLCQVKLLFSGSTNVVSITVKSIWYRFSC